MCYKALQSIDSHLVWESKGSDKYKGQTALITVPRNDETSPNKIN